MKVDKNVLFGIMALCLAAVCSTVSGQKAPLSVNSSSIQVNFGLPVVLKDDSPASDSIRYLQTGAILSSDGENVAAAGDGVVLFIQQGSALYGGMPSASGNLLALAHADGFVSIYSDKEFSPYPVPDREIAQNSIIGSVTVAPGSTAARYLLRVFDGASGLWVNPAFFIPGLQDKAAPRIEELALLGQGRYRIAENLKKDVQKIPQGNYTIAVHVVDPSYSKGAVSGIFRMKAVLNGQIVLDKKFDSAQITTQGLAFLGLDAPSSKVADNNGRLVLGQQFFARGTHVLEFFAYDFAGNVGSFLWKFSAE